jgi:hypothetical protein
LYSTTPAFRLCEDHIFAEVCFAFESSPMIPLLNVDGFEYTPKYQVKLTIRSRLNELSSLPEANSAAFCNASPPAAARTARLAAR